MGLPVDITRGAITGVLATTMAATTGAVVTALL